MKEVRCMHLAAIVTVNPLEAGPPYTFISISACNRVVCTFVAFEMLAVCIVEGKEESLFSH